MAFPFFRPEKRGARGDQAVPCSKLTESAASSRDEVPTVAVKVPLASVHACAVASQTESLRAVSAKETTWLPPAARLTLVKPLSCWGGSPAAMGKRSVTLTVYSAAVVAAVAEVAVEAVLVVLGVSWRSESLKLE
eukprot:scaffold15954_cov62-Phaeocystis_antarctica.AAC.4